MDGAIVTFLNIAILAALVVLFFIVLDVPVARPTKRNTSANSHSHRK